MMAMMIEMVRAEENNVVLSVAKDLIATCNRYEILRFAQDDRVDARSASKERVARRQARVRMIVSSC